MAGVPSEIRLSADKQTLTVVFDGARFALPAEYLRVESPSAEVKGHGVGQERLVSGKKGISITTLEPVGNYAVRMVFSDGHGSGIFTWDYLRALGEEQEARWEKYLTDLDKAGLNREKSGPVVLRAKLG